VGEYGDYVPVLSGNKGKAIYIRARVGENPSGAKPNKRFGRT